MFHLATVPVAPRRQPAPTSTASTSTWGPSSTPSPGGRPGVCSVLSQRRGPFLVIAPLSTLGHWRRELDEWTVGGGAATRRLQPPGSEASRRAAQRIPVVVDVSGASPGAVPTSASRALPRLHTIDAAAASAPLNVVLYHGSVRSVECMNSCRRMALPPTPCTTIALPPHNMLPVSQGPSRAAIRECEWFFTDPATGVVLRPGHVPPPPREVELEVDAAAQRSGFALPEDGTSTRLVPTFKFDVLLTTYEMVISDASVLASVPWAAIVVDEAHRLKNGGSKLVVELERFSRDACVLLTGTPIQNRYAAATARRAPLRVPRMPIIVARSTLFDFSTTRFHPYAMQHGGALVAAALRGAARLRERCRRRQQRSHV